MVVRVGCRAVVFDEKRNGAEPYEAGRAHRPAFEARVDARKYGKPAAAGSEPFLHAVVQQRAPQQECDHAGARLLAPQQRRVKSSG